MNWFDSKKKKIAVGFGVTALLFALGTLTPGGSKAAPPGAPVTVTNIPLPVLVSNQPTVNLASGTGVNVNNLPLVNLASGTSVNVNNSLSAPVPVQMAIPNQPFFQDIGGFAQGQDARKVGGPGNGKLAITSITATNASGAIASFIVSPVLLSGGSPGTCNGTFVTEDPGLEFSVPALSTTQLTFPSPLVIGPSSAGQTCFVVDAIMTGSSARLDFVGFVQ